MARSEIRRPCIGGGHPDRKHFFSTTRDAAHRNNDPNEKGPNGERLCDAPQADWSILTDPRVQNDEWRAIKQDRRWRILLRCAVQTHILPPPHWTGGSRTPLSYTLAFLEFKENGDPYPLVSARRKEFSPNELADKRVFDQLGALAERLKANPSNSVVTWVHGWRHDASLGDGNVANLRVYAAHAARFLDERCKASKAAGETSSYYCDAKVTAVYIGWRGARVDEQKIARLFKTIGETFGTADFSAETVGASPTYVPVTLTERTEQPSRIFGEFGADLGMIAAIPTLFDRKPVSEQIAPYALTALRTIDVAVGDRPHKIIIFGHSLGGNMLAQAMKDDLVKLVRRRPYSGGRTFKPPAGDLVVLINPASEASKWTAIQRAIWEKVAVRPSDEVTGSTASGGHRFFPPDQPPVVISVTAALSWPPGGIRPRDCAESYGSPERLARYKPSDPKYPGEVQKIRESQKSLVKKIAESGKLMRDVVAYDWATYDLFPAFKGDFRPLANRLDRARATFVRGGAFPDACDPDRGSQMGRRAVALPLRAIASLLRNFPFMNTDHEQTRTIGHLDPPRHFASDLTAPLISALPFGTTHELMGLADRGSEKTTAYENVAASSEVVCPSARSWLTRARAHQDAQPNGHFWDSTKLAPGAESKGEGSPTARFIHGFSLAGVNAITRANDPFWNMRAFDNALAKHDGYMLSSFICAMHQLVMDDVAAPLRVESSAAPTEPLATPTPVNQPTSP